MYVILGKVDMDKPQEVFIVKAKDSNEAHRIANTEEQGFQWAFFPDDLVRGLLDVKRGCVCNSI